MPEPCALPEGLPALATHELPHTAGEASPQDASVERLLVDRVSAPAEAVPPLTGAEVSPPHISAADAPAVPQPAAEAAPPDASVAGLPLGATGLAEEGALSVEGLVAQVAPSGRLRLVEETRLSEGLSANAVPTEATRVPAEAGLLAQEQPPPSGASPPAEESASTEAPASKPVLDEPPVRSAPSPAASELAGPPVKRRRIVGKTPPPLAATSSGLPAPATSGSSPPLRPLATVLSRAPPAPLLPLSTLVINLDRRRRRWKAVGLRLRPFERSRLLVVERLHAVDGSCEAIPVETVSLSWSTDRNSKFDGRPGYRAGVKLEMSAGERGCAASHVAAWRIAAAAPGGRPTLILEDDAMPAKRFAERLPDVLDAAPPDTDALYLGYIPGAPWRRQLAGGLCEAEYLWTTVAYVLWPRGARRLLSRLPVDEPVDNFMAWEMTTRRLMTFAVHPPLVKQAGAWDAHSDVPHSDDAVLDGLV
eukprot:NODE_5557_length_1757_cov_6.201840.p1 GENE.NODE_5557_length_1757_cov_6.201840~~NODE_5557_length_1757_cov_6.201840.p1  ORF type:complete len:530 (-),score=142.31 NODE_5557_length_1757_cov_6.201840:168-1598(-)